jgi:hypothetical protein
MRGSIACRFNAASTLIVTGGLRFTTGVRRWLGLAESKERATAGRRRRRCFDVITTGSYATEAKMPVTGATSRRD